MITVLSDAQIPLFKAQAATQNHPIPLATLLMLDAGLRLAEVCSIRWETLVWGNDPKGAIVLPAKHTKRNVTRTIPISSDLATTIRDAWRASPAYRSDAYADFATATRLHGDPIIPRTLQRAIKRLGRSALNMDLHPHILRHTFATRVLRVSDMRVTQMALGHKNISTTQIYTHPNSEDLGNAVAKL